MNETPKVPGNNSLPQGTTPGVNPTGGASPAGGANPKAAAIDKGVDVLDKALGENENSPKVGDQVIDPKAPKTDEEGNPTQPDLKVGDKVAPGYEVGEDGKVKQSSVSKMQGAITRGMTIYATGGNKDAAQLAGKISDSRVGRQLSDKLEKNKAVKKAADELEDVADIVNTASKAVQDLQNGDVKETIKNAKEIKKSYKKFRNKQLKKYALAFILINLPLILGIMIIMVLAMAVADENDTSSKQVYENSYNYTWPDTEDDDDGENEHGGEEEGGGETPISNAEIEAIIAEIPGFNELSSTRQAVIRAALSAVGLKYLFGGKPTGPGLSGIPSSGIDCSGFVRWAYWTGTGSDPGFAGTSDMVNNMNTWFEKITWDQMQPGDIVVRRTSDGGHTAIYLGNNRYVHARGKKYGIAVSSNTNHAYYQYYFRYKGL